jgi:hypothetical protein
MKIYKIVIALLVGTGLAFLGLYQWRSHPGNSFESARSMKECIYEDKNTRKSIVHSEENIFEVNFVEHSAESCVNPFFPIINVKIRDNIQDAWIHIISTDSTEQRWRKFIDNDPNFAPLPFYNFEEEFFDAPLWTYTIFNKPLSFWKANLYAVQLDKQNKTIKFLGGISWGFTLGNYSLKPKMTTPSSLSIKEWSEDWQVFGKYLIEYKQL